MQIIDVVFDKNSIDTKEEATMEIIKKGTKTPPDKITYVTKCRTCGCEFTYMERDIKKVCVEDITKVVCPQCNYWVYPIIKRKYKGGKK